MTVKMYSALSDRQNRIFGRQVVTNLRVIQRSALRGTVAFEVADHRGRVVANVTKVNRLTTLAEEQETIKDLEQLCGGLVDGTEDGEALICKVAKERHDSPGGLRVKTGGRFVQEEQETGLGSKLDSNCGSLAVLDAERANDGVGVRLETTHLQTFLDARKVG